MYFPNIHILAPLPFNELDNILHKYLDSNKIVQNILIQIIRIIMLFGCVILLLIPFIQMYSMEQKLRFCDIWYETPIPKVYWISFDIITNFIIWIDQIAINLTYNMNFIDLKINENTVMWIPLKLIWLGFGISYVFDNCMLEYNKNTILCLILETINLISFSVILYLIHYGKLQRPHSLYQQISEQNELPEPYVPNNISNIIV